MEELMSHAEISGALSVFPKTQWIRLIRAFLFYGTYTFQQKYKMDEMTVDGIERVIYGASQGHRKEDSMDLFMREIETIRNEIMKLDQKIDGSLPLPVPVKRPSPPLPTKPETCKHIPQPLNMPKAPSPPRTRPAAKGYPGIYPAWWGAPDSNRRDNAENVQPPSQDPRRVEEVSERYKHELEVSAIAAENARINYRLAQRNPVKMVFEKAEFSGHQLHVRPNPVIIEKRREGPMADPREGTLQSRDTNAYPVPGPKGHYVDAERDEEEHQGRNVAESTVEYATGSGFSGHMSQQRPSLDGAGEGRESPYGLEEDNVGASINMRALSNVGMQSTELARHPREEEVRQTVPMNEGRNIYAVPGGHAYTYSRGVEDNRPGMSEEESSSGSKYSHSRPEEVMQMQDEYNKARKEFTLSGDPNY